eukprot:c22735_g1_i1 orf=151-1368(+)
MTILEGVMAFSMLPPRPMSLPPFKSSRLIMSVLPFEGAVYRRELEAAVDVVERACLLCNSVRRSMSMVGNEQMKKSDLSPVTIADFGVQSLIGMELGLLFPSIPLVGEEDAGILRLEVEERGSKITNEPTLLDMVVEAVSKVASSGIQPVSSNSVLEAIDRGGEASPFLQPPEQMSTFWVLDPIDGTRGFLEGGDALYVIGLSLVVEGNMVLGVMGCPCLTHANMAMSISGKRMIWAVDKIMNRGNVQSWRSNGVLMAAYKGYGSWIRSLHLEATCKAKDLMEQNFVQSLVDGSTTVDDAQFGLSRHEEWALTPLANLVDSVAASNEDFVFHICCGSLCKYFAVAIGAISAVLLPQNEDVKVTDGEGFDIENLLSKGGRTFVAAGNNILVTNSHLHHIILRHLST